MGKMIAALCMVVCLLCAAACAQTVTPQETATAQEAAEFRAAVQFDDFNAYVKENTGVRFCGTLAANAPIRRVEAVVWDLRQLEALGEYIWEQPESGDDVYSLELYDMRRDLFPVYRTGEFEIVITVYGDICSAEALRQRMYVAGDLSAPRNMNADCTFSCSEKRRYVWTDGEISTEWQPTSAQDVLRIDLPEGRSAAGIALIWQTLPAQASIRALDGQGALLQETVLDESSFLPLHAWYALPQGTRAVEISIPGCEAVSELLVVEEGLQAGAIEQWEPTPEKCELMLIPTHQDDEHIFFGALISEYAERETGVLYMVDCGRSRYSEALNGLWAAGLKNYPVFLGMRDGLIKTKKTAFNYWGGADAVVSTLVEQIRKYRPEVIVTHDFAGEYDNAQHQVTAECVAKAVECAADPEWYPESAQEYGAWQVKKLYVHLYEENEIVFAWDAPRQEWGGMTGLEISQMCYSMHRSQQHLVSYQLGLKYDNSRFGLYYSCVGEDTGKGDLFENIE